MGLVSVVPSNRHLEGTIFAWCQGRLGHGISPVIVLLRLDTQMRSKVRPYLFNGTFNPHTLQVISTNSNKAFPHTGFVQVGRIGNRC